MMFAKKKTKVVNLVAGPGAGKSVVAAYLFAALKIRGHSAEYVQEYAKQLVWLEDFETLNNQHHVSKEQYRLFKAIDGKVDFIVTDGSLLHGLWYNKNNSGNVSDIAKTESAILRWYNEFDNIVVFLDREEIPYEQAGRIQTEDEAKVIDSELKDLLEGHGVPYASFRSDLLLVDDIADYVEE